MFRFLVTIVLWVSLSTHALATIGEVTEYKGSSIIDRAGDEIQTDEGEEVRVRAPKSMSYAACGVAEEQQSQYPHVAEDADLGCQETLVENHSVDCCLQRILLTYEVRFHFRFHR